MAVEAVIYQVHLTSPHDWAPPPPPYVEAVIYQVQNRAEFGAFFIANFSPVTKKERISESPMLDATTQWGDLSLDDREDLWRFQYDSHFQFNDLLHAKYSTMTLLYHLTSWRLLGDQAVKPDKKTTPAKKALELPSPPPLKKPVEVAPRGDEQSDVVRRWHENSAVAEECRIEQTALGGDCEDDYLCPTICNCGEDICECKCRRFVFCEWCRSWQHQCCAQQAVGYRADSSHQRTTKGFYDATLEYQCYQCLPCVTGTKGSQTHSSRNGANGKHGTKSRK
jgi:hypothetical protein